MKEQTIKVEEITPDIAKELHTKQLIEVAFGRLHVPPWLKSVIEEIIKRLNKEGEEMKCQECKEKCIICGGLPQYKLKMCYKCWVRRNECKITPQYHMPFI